MNLIEINSAIQMVVYCTLIGWALAYLYRPEDGGIVPHFFKLILNIVMNTVVIGLMMVYIPGITHPVYVFALSALLLFNPYFVITIEAREPIQPSAKGNVYSYLISATFMVTLMPTLGFLITNFTLYWPLAIIQAGCLASIVVTKPPELIHQQQRLIMRQHRESVNEE